MRKMIDKAVECFSRQGEQKPLFGKEEKRKKEKKAIEGTKQGT